MTKKIINIAMFLGREEKNCKLFSFKFQRNGTTKKQTAQDDSRLVGTSYIFNETFNFSSTMETKITLNKSTAEYKPKIIDFALNEVDVNEKFLKTIGVCSFDLSTVMSTRKEVDLEFKEKSNLFKKTKLSKTLKIVLVSTPSDEE
jgi:hypothetical protein